jgi:hypothetical protein
MKARKRLSIPSKNYHRRINAYFKFGCYAQRSDATLARRPRQVFENIDSFVKTTKSDASSVQSAIPTRGQSTNPDWKVGFGGLIHLVYCNLSRIVD